jgi:tetratricopeptide (TPR) repeat protein
MYPYMEPFQTILKINKDPLPRLTPDKVQRDRQFWDAYTTMLTNDVRFARDIDAQKSFSKLRTAVAGLYTWRGMNGQPELNAEADYAYQQALGMCPDSPETNFRYVDLLSRLERFDDSLVVLERFRKLDPLNAQIPRVIDTVKSLKKNVEDQSQWEERYKVDPNNVDIGLRLVQIYYSRGRIPDADRVADNLMQSPGIQSNHLIQLAQLYAQPNAQRLDRVLVVLTALTTKFPDIAAAWYDLAVVTAVMNRPDSSLAALEQAILRGGEPIRNQAKIDQRLGGIREHPHYKQIVGE